MSSDPVFEACPPCKVVICGGDVVEGAQRVASQVAITMELFKLKRFKRDDAIKLVSELDQIEDEMNECAERLKDINERIAKA